MISVVLGELLECQRYLMSDPKRIPSKLIFDLMKDTTLVVSIDFIYILYIAQNIITGNYKRRSGLIPDKEAL